MEQIQHLSPLVYLYFTNIVRGDSFEKGTELIIVNRSVHSWQGASSSIDY
jgi:hypothetical protein